MNVQIFISQPPLPVKLLCNDNTVVNAKNVVSERTRRLFPFRAPGGGAEGGNVASAPHVRAALATTQSQ